jgi:hypothetical protein
MGTTVWWISMGIQITIRVASYHLGYLLFGGSVKKEASRG